jgi:hypothetical protein
MRAPREVQVLGVDVGAGKLSAQKSVGAFKQIDARGNSVQAFSTGAMVAEALIRAARIDPALIPGILPLGALIPAHGCSMYRFPPRWFPPQ